MDDRIATLKSILNTAFFGGLIGLAIINAIADRRMNAAAKRKWMPRGAILVGILFVCFAATMAVLETRSWSSLGILVLIVPGVFLVMYLITKATKFCDKCGATLYNNSSTPMIFCPKCGAELVTIKPSQGDNLLE